MVMMRLSACRNTEQSWAENAVLVLAGVGKRVEGFLASNFFWHAEGPCSL